MFKANIGCTSELLLVFLGDLIELVSSHVLTFVTLSHVKSTSGKRRTIEFRDAERIHFPCCPTYKKLIILTRTVGKR